MDIMVNERGRKHSDVMVNGENAVFHAKSQRE